MNAIILLLASTTLGGDVGWQPLAGGGFEYIIQIAPDELESLKAGRDIINELPPELAGVKRYRITVGTGPVPRIGTPPEVSSGQFSPNAATSIPATSNAAAGHDPFASSRAAGKAAGPGDGNANQPDPFATSSPNTLSNTAGAATAGNPTAANADDDFVNRVRDRINGGAESNVADTNSATGAATSQGAGSQVGENVPQMSENPFRDGGSAANSGVSGDGSVNSADSATQDRYATNPGSATQDRYANAPDYRENASRFSAGSAGQDLNPQSPPGHTPGSAANDAPDAVAPEAESSDHGELPFGEYLLPLSTAANGGVDPFAASGYGAGTSSQDETNPSTGRYGDRYNTPPDPFSTGNPDANKLDLQNTGGQPATDENKNYSSGRLKLSDVGASDPFAAKKESANSSTDGETAPPTLNPDNATRLANYRSDEVGPSNTTNKNKAKSADVEPSEQPGWMWTLVVLAMFASLGTNGWLALLLRDSRRKYDDLLERYQQGDDAEGYEDDVHYEAA